MNRLDAKVLRHSIVIGAGGRRVLRLLLPSQCRFSCVDCPFVVVPETERRAGDELSGLDALARSVASAYRAGMCDSVFVTAGVPLDAGSATRRLVQFVELLRFKYVFRGYLHVKALPGADAGLTQRLVRLVDRVSYALEPLCASALRERAGLTPEAANELESRAFAELQRARSASGRSSPPLLPAVLQTPRTGARRGDQASLFDARKPLNAIEYGDLATP